MSEVDNDNVAQDTTLPVPPPVVAMAENKDETIIKYPRPEDVLLGQGYYRHPGNQALNTIVDAKVEEYRNQTRVFKTYMAHDIIQRMRKKGTRFLKELAPKGPKGWMIVTDDAEPREKVAQRFQYMMRKHKPAEEKAEIGEPTTCTSENSKGASTGEKVPLSQPNLLWRGHTVKVPFLPVFHQLQKTSVMVDEDINAVATRLLDCFSIIGVNDSFNYERANAILNIPRHLKIHMNLWKPLGGNKGVIVELINLKQQTNAFQKYSRYVLEAATGLFEKYKHTMMESRIFATASVQDQVTTYKANMDSKKGATSSNAKNTQDKAAASSSSKEPGAGSTAKAVKSVGERALQEPKIKKINLEPPPSTKKGDHKPAAKRPSIKNSEMKFPPLDNDASRCEKDISVPDPERASLTGNFASAFSRYESVVEAADNTTRVAPATQKLDTARRWSSVVAKGVDTSNAQTATAFMTDSRRLTSVTAKDPSASLVQTCQPMPTAVARRWSSVVAGEAPERGPGLKPVPVATVSSNPSQEIKCEPKRWLAAATKDAVVAPTGVSACRPSRMISEEVSELQKMESGSKRRLIVAKEAYGPRRSQPHKPDSFDPELSHSRQKTKTSDMEITFERSAPLKVGEVKAFKRGAAPPTEVAPSGALFTECAASVDLLPPVQKKAVAAESLELDPEPIRRLSLHGDGPAKGIPADKDPCKPFPMAGNTIVPLKQEEMKWGCGMEYKHEAAKDIPTEEDACKTYPIGGNTSAPLNQEQMKWDCGMEYKQDAARDMPADRDACKPYPIVGNTNVPLNQEEMKWDCGMEYKQETEVASMDHTIESIKRLSLSSNDASFCEPRRPPTDLFEAFPLGLMSNALSNQEMKCDSSLDDEPFVDGSITSKQSFLPSSFFGSGAPNPRSNSRGRANAPSPANSNGSRISVEMRSVPSPSTSFNSHISIEITSLPSPCGSFNSRCSLGMNSLKNARTDEALSPSVFQSDLSADKQDPNGGARQVPPTIFVDSSSALGGQSD